MRDVVTKEVFILGGARTPMAEYAGKLKDISALELGAIASRAAFERTGVKPEAVDHVVFGNVLQTSSDAVYGARHVGLKSGVPIEVPALTVNRLCGSGIQAAVSGAQLILLERSGRRAHRRHGEHEPGAARDPRSAQRSAARAGAARRHAVVGAARYPLRMHDGGHRRELRREVQRRRERSRTSTRFAASSSPTRRGRKGGSRTKSSRSNSSRAKARSSSPRTTTCGRIRRWKGWRSCRRRSARTAA